jgi:hypothetical protein
MKPLIDFIGYLRLFGFCSRVLLAGVIALFSATSGSAQSLSFDSGLRAKGAVIAVHLGWETEPAAVLRAERVFSDYQTRGFFRIGALPLLVMEKLRIELHDTARLSTVLASVSERFATRGNAWKAIEGRDFCLSFCSPKDGQVRARRIRLESGGAWALLDGALEAPEAAPIPFSRAALTITGPRAGELVCETPSGTIQVHLLSLTTSTIHKPPS